MTAKIDIAIEQLEDAVHLYLDRKRFLSSLTLAGAAEEILGKMAVAHHLKNAADELAECAASIKTLVYKEPAKAADMRDRANQPRNMAKHFDNDAPWSYDAEHEAGAMINRAIDNYWQLLNANLAQMEPEWMKHFRQSSRYSNMRSSPQHNPKRF